MEVKCFSSEKGLQRATFPIVVRRPLAEEEIEVTATFQHFLIRVISCENEFLCMNSATLSSISGICNQFMNDVKFARPIT